MNKPVNVGEVMASEDSPDVPTIADDSAGGKPPADSDPGNRIGKMHELLFDSAMELASCQDPDELVLENFSEVRKEAEAIVCELRSLKPDHNQGEEASSRFTDVAQELSNRLVKLLTNAHLIATRNLYTTLEYWKDADRPQEDLQGSLNSLCESLDKLGINVPGSEERRIRELAFQYSYNRELWNIH
jgi:hypothetical protein